MHIAFLLVALIVFGYGAPAEAQVPAPTFTASELTHLNRIIAGASGVTTVGITGAAQVSAAGSVTAVTASGVRIPVMVTATATVPGATIATAARFLIKAAGPIGVAYTGYEVYKAVNDLGITTCAAPEFFCKAAPVPPGYCATDCYNWTGTYPNGTVGPIRTTPDAAGVDICTFYKATYFQGSNPTCGPIFVNTATQYRINLYYNNGANLYGFSNINRGAARAADSTLPPVSMTTTEMDTAIADRIANSTLGGKKLFDAVRVDNARQGVLSDSQIVPAATPATYSAPPVASPQTVVKTETTTNPDASTQTRKTMETTSLTTTATGTTVGDVKPKFDATTTTVVTTTNNTTNVTTTESTTVTTPPPAAEKTEMPKDYAREPTLQKVVDSLDATTAPSLPDQDQRINTAKTTADQDLQAKRDEATSGVEASKSMWFSWVWTPPVGACSPFAGSVHGFAVSWDLCPVIAQIRDVIGWLFAIFGAIEIYGQLFKRND